MGETRTCVKCGVEKPIDEFPMNGKYRRRKCGECLREIRRTPEKKEAEKRYRAKWISKNPNYNIEYKKQDSRILDDSGRYIPFDVSKWNSERIEGRPVEDLTGRVFGKFTAMEFLGSDKRGQAWWRFLCECGVIKDLKASDVKSGRTESCGCIQRKDITGQRFGRLIAIENTGKQPPNRHSYIWRCICDCGNEVEVQVAYLVNGNTRSCGCLRDEVIRTVNTTHGLSKTKGYRRGLAHNHREKYLGLDSIWNGLMEFALDELFQSCVICGSTDRLETDHVYPKSKGYGLKPGNAVKLCRKHNGSGFKGNKMPEELPDYARDKILEAAHKFEVYWNSLGVSNGV